MWPLRIRYQTVDQWLVCPNCWSSFLVQISIHPAIQIDNEYSQNPAPNAEYFVDLEATYHDSPIVVPLTYNDPGQGRNFVNGTVSVYVSWVHSLIGCILGCSRPIRVWITCFWLCRLVAKLNHRLDSYPQGFDCSNPTVWRGVPTNFHQYHADVNPSQPWYIPGRNATRFLNILLILLCRIPGWFLRCMGTNSTWYGSVAL